MRASAIQQAKDLFSKLVNLKINKATIPNLKRVYPVATVGDGTMLMSDGSKKIAPIYKEKAKVDAENIVPNQSNQDKQNLVQNASLRMAIPTEQLGTGTNTAFAFMDFLNKVLQPTIAEGISAVLPAMIPALEASGKFQTPFALANLPQLGKQNIPNLFQENVNFFNKALSSAQSIQQSLAEDFAKQFSKIGEAEVNLNVENLRRLPLVRGYTESYRLPTSQNAEYAQIGNNVNAFNRRI